MCTELELEVETTVSNINLLPDDHKALKSGDFKHKINNGDMDDLADRIESVAGDYSKNAARILNKSVKNPYYEE